MRRTRRGVTLVELLVVLALLGVAAGVTGLAFRAARAAPSPTEAALGHIARARREAILTGRSVSTIVQLDSAPRAVTAHPDGRVLVDALTALDALSGRPRLEDTVDAHR